MPCPPPGDLPNPGIKATSLMSPALAGGFCPRGDFFWRDGGCWRPVLRTGSASFTSTMMYLRACVLSRFSHVRLFATLLTITRQAPLSMGFSRQEYWSGLPCPPPGDLPNPGIETMSLAPALAGRFFTTSTSTIHRLTHTKVHRGILDILFYSI